MIIGERNKLTLKRIHPEASPPSFEPPSNVYLVERQMNRTLKQLLQTPPTKREGLLCFGGLILSGLMLYYASSGEEINWKFLSLGALLCFTSLMLLPGTLYHIFLWVRAFYSDINPQTIPLALPADRLRDRLLQIRDRIVSLASDTSIQIEVMEKRAVWVDDYCLDIHLLKQSWCASVSLPCGGILFPLQLKRIATKTAIQLPKRFLKSELTSCILCWEKGQLHIFPGNCASTLLNELSTGLLANDDCEFAHWLSSYHDLLTEE